VSLEFELAAVPKVARFAQVGDLVVSARTVGLAPGPRVAKLTIAKRWRSQITRKTKLTLRTVAIDASGNRSTISRTLKLRK